MNDEVLGMLQPDERTVGALTGTIPYRDKKLTLHLDPEGGDLSLTIALARALVSSIAVFDRKARVAAATSLLGDYNDSWREFEKAREDGTFATVSSPQLTESEFMARIDLEAVEITGSELCCLWYADNGLFAGHSIMVTSFDGAAFSDLQATLFG